MPIYRRGNRTPMNFTLRTQDIEGLPYDEQGLSASDEQEVGMVQQVLDDNLDGRFNYVDAPVDGNPYHILIRPIGDSQADVEGQMTAWAAARIGINPNSFVLPNATIPLLTTQLNNAWIGAV